LSRSDVDRNGKEQGGYITGDKKERRRKWEEAIIIVPMSVEILGRSMSVSSSVDSPEFWNIIPVVEVLHL